MKVFDIEILTHNEDTNIFTVRYCIDKGKGVVRRSVATYFEGQLSRDNDKLEITKEIKQLLRIKHN